MAKYRQLHTSFWNDPLILDLTPEQKYFYIYILTNPNVKQCGIYEISIRQIIMHTGYNKDTIENLLDHFQKLNKIVISKKTNEIAIVNFLKYNYSASPTVKKCVEKDLNEVKNKELIKYIYSIDTLSIDYGDNKEEEEEEVINNNKKKKNNKKSLPTTEDDFKNYVYKLDNKKHHDDFINYWCEGWPNKMRFQFEKTFDIERRLSRWSKSDFNKKNKMPDFYDKAYADRIKQDQSQQKLYREHLLNLGYIQKYSYNGEPTWIKQK